MRVYDIMTHEVIACRADSTAEQASQIMWDQDVGIVPVLGDDGTVLGVVTDRDLCMACYTRGLRPHDIIVASVMSGRVVACRPDATLGTAGELMRQHQVRRLLVTDSSSRLVGILSLSDMALHRAGSCVGYFDEVSEVLAAICGAHRQRTKAAEAPVTAVASPPTPERRPNAQAS